MSDTTIKTPAGRTYELGAELGVDTVKVFDVPVKQYIPLTVEAYEQATARQGSCVEHAVAYTIARSGASRMRAMVIKAIETKWSIKPTEGEKPEPFLKRVRAEKTAAEVNALIDSTLSDPTLYIVALETSKERGSAGVTKEVLKIVSETRERWASGDSSPSNTAALFAERGIVWDEPSEDISDDDLATKVAAYLKALRTTSL